MCVCLFLFFFFKQKASLKATFEIFSTFGKSGLEWKLFFQNKEGDGFFLSAERSSKKADSLHWDLANHLKFRNVSNCAFRLGKVSRGIARLPCVLNLRQRDVVKRERYR